MAAFAEGKPLRFLPAGSFCILGPQGRAFDPALAGDAQKRMAWYWAAIVTGFIATPFVMRNFIRAAFQEYGLGAALGVWLGGTWLTVSVTMALFWLVTRFL